MPSARSRLGRSAEIVAAAELGRRGYRILAANYRCRCGEIDFVAADHGTLVFVEVRCKRSDEFGTPAESIGPSKQRKIALTAEHYLHENSVHDLACRFDVVEVVADDSGRLIVSDIIRDAFST